MQITRDYKTELGLNNEQVTACKKHAGTARFAYNWDLKRKQEVYRQQGAVSGRCNCKFEFGSIGVV